MRPRVSSIKCKSSDCNVEARARIACRILWFSIVLLQSSLSVFRVLHYALEVRLFLLHLFLPFLEKNTIPVDPKLFAWWSSTLVSHRSYHLNVLLVEEPILLLDARQYTLIRFVVSENVGCIVDFTGAVPSEAGQPPRAERYPPSECRSYTPNSPPASKHHHHAITAYW